LSREQTRREGGAGEREEVAASERVRHSR
jgi:hypothetical protein